MSTALQVGLRSCSIAERSRLSESGHGRVMPTRSVSLPPQRGDEDDLLVLWQGWIGLGAGIAAQGASGLQPARGARACTCLDCK
jgi:hypothetical protein